MKLRELFRKLIHLNNSPPEIALGVAIGVFIAVTPLYGFHTIMVVVAAFLVRRANKIAILVGTNISLPPTFPFITWTGYDIGRLILRNDYPALSWTYFKNFSYKRILEFYFPLFVGSVVLGLILAGVFYFITLIFVTQWRKRKARLKNA